MTTTRPAASRRVTSPAVRTGEAFLRVQLHLGARLWAIAAAIAVVLTVVFDRTGTIEGSTWENVDQGPRWFLFAMALIMVTGYLPAHVANGMTRRSFTAALGAAMAVTSAGYAVLWTLGYAVERLVFAARGWPTDLGSAHLADGGLLGLGLEGLALFVIYAASGMLVGATYYRGGGWWGTLTLPLTVGPALLAEALLSGSRLAGVLPAAWSADGSARPVAVLVLVLIAAGLAAAGHLLIRDAPVRTKAG
jgi:hypothetical protein